MKAFELRRLSPLFYENYPETLYPEMEHKQNRPYMVLLVKIGDNRFALPLRTNIRHAYCYAFSETDRTTASTTGIDYTKAVIVNDDRFLGVEASIDDKEYLEVAEKHFFIAKQFKNYLDGYIDVVKNGGSEYKRRRYTYSTLKYFHKELGLR